MIEPEFFYRKLENIVEEERSSYDEKIEKLIILRDLLKKLEEPECSLICSTFIDEQIDKKHGRMTMAEAIELEQSEPW